MIPDDPDALAKSRLLKLTLVRLAGVAVMALGLSIAAGDLVRPGGLPALGLPVSLAGFAASILLPRRLARRWRTPPSP